MYLTFKNYKKKVIITINIKQLITAMATHKFLPLDGGREYVRFLVGECSRKVAPSLQEASVHERTGGAQRALEEEENMRRKQREMSMHLINLMALTVEETEQVFEHFGGFLM